MTASDLSPVAVVTGGALGIGAAIAEELARAGMFVVVVDPGVTMDGEGLVGQGGVSTVDRILQFGGRARSSSVSVTDAGAVQALFGDLVEEFGAVETVVNVAGILRPTGFGRGTENDWRAVLEVHLDGYLNVLRAALPRMVAAGRGQIVGVTSGAGWRQADNGAYGCAKRAVAAVTWELGRVLDHGVSVNALSPIAATRMVAGALSRPGAEARAAGRDASTGAVALGDARPPEHLGPIGAFLASRDFGLTCSGEVMSSNGAELSWIVRPTVMEIIPLADGEGGRPSIAALVSGILAPAERAQASGGGSTPRLSSPQAPGSTDSPARPTPRHVLVVSGHALSETIRAAVSLDGAICSTVGPARGFAECSELLVSKELEFGPVDAVIVLPSANQAAHAAADQDSFAWQRCLDEHRGVTSGILADAGWMHAVAESSARSGRKVRVVVFVDATSAGGRSRAQAAAQLSRGAHISSSGNVDGFAISLESRLESVLGCTTDLAAYLVAGVDASDLSGAELVVSADWLGLRAHPRPATTVSYGGPELPSWLGDTLHDVVRASSPRVA